MRAYPLIVLTIFLSLSLLQGEEDKISILLPAQAQIMIDNKPCGTALLPFGQEYEFLGIQGKKFILRLGSTCFLVDPLATDYWEHKLIAELSPEPKPVAKDLTPPVQYLADVAIYPLQSTVSDSQSTSDSVTMNLDRPFREITQNPYNPGYFYPGGYSSTFIIYNTPVYSYPCLTAPVHVAHPICLTLQRAARFQIPVPHS